MNEILEQPVTLSKLTMWDRCDAPGVKAPISVTVNPGCEERAYVLVQFPGGLDLAFCKHHYEAKELVLMSAGAIVVDDNRSDLEVKPGVSAAS